MGDVLWLIWRDEGEGDDLARAERAMAAFRRRTGLEPEVVGVPSSFGREAEAALRMRGLDIRHNLHAWQRHEIWVGAEDAG